MNSINDLFQQAQLAEAAYADLDGVENSNQLKTALMNIGGEGKGFSDAQATEFRNQWKVVDHIPDTVSGFSVQGSGSKYTVTRETA